MIKKIAVLFFIGSLSAAFPAMSDSIHKVASKETFWFIAKLYYGDGNKFKEIIFANQKKSENEIRVGEELVVPLPKYSNKAVDFPERYAALAKERDELLAKKKLVAPATAKQEAAVSRRQPAAVNLKRPADLQGKSIKGAADQELKSK